jgi:hypothetical protein
MAFPVWWTVAIEVARARACGLLHAEEGSVAEKVVLTAIFVSLAIVAGTIIYNAVRAKASSISYQTP